MLRKASEAVPEGNDPVPQKEKLGSGQLTWGDVYPIMKGAPIYGTRIWTRFRMR